MRLGMPLASQHLRVLRICRTETAGLTSTTARGYDVQFDYVLHVKGQVLTPARVAATVAAYRSAGTTFEDTVRSS